MLPHILFKSVILVLIYLTNTASCQGPIEQLVSRRFTEYLMPAAAETHEFARVPNSNFVLLSQMSDSQLVKIELDQDTQEPIALQSFPIGDSKSGLHGVFPSVLYPGLVVCISLFFFFSLPPPPPFSSPEILLRILQRLLV